MVYCTADVLTHQSIKFFFRIASFGAGAILVNSPSDVSSRVGEAFFASSVFTLTEYLVRYGHLSKCCSRYNLGEGWGEKGKIKVSAFCVGVGSSYFLEMARESLFYPSQGGYFTFTWTKTFAAAFPFLLATELIDCCVSACHRAQQKASERAVLRMSSDVLVSAAQPSRNSSSWESSDVPSYSRLESLELSEIT